MAAYPKHYDEWPIRSDQSYSVKSKIIVDLVFAPTVSLKPSRPHGLGFIFLFLVKGKDGLGITKALVRTTHGESSRVMVKPNQEVESLRKGVWMRYMVRGPNFQVAELTKNIFVNVITFPFLHYRNDSITLHFNNTLFFKTRMPEAPKSLHNLPY